LIVVRDRKPFWRRGTDIEFQYKGVRKREAVIRKICIWMAN
jgi:hypothetical protein